MTVIIFFFDHNTLICTKKERALYRICLMFHKQINNRIMMNKKIFELQADVCKALAHPIRMEIIHLLREEELCFAKISEATGSLKSNLSQHLKIMTKKGIVKVRKDGQCRHFSLSSKKVAEACQLMHEVLFQNIKEQQELLKNS